MNGKVITFFLITVCTAAGICMLFFGISGAVHQNQITKSYDTIDGYFTDYSIYSSDEDGTTYRLTYSYVLNYQEYTVSTDYGVGSIPEPGSVKTIKYNPKNPEEAVIVGSNQNSFLILMGILFTFVPLFIAYGALTTFGYLKRFPEKVVSIGIGILFTVIGVGIIYLQAGGFSIQEAVASLSFWIVIPLLFIVVGIYQTVRSIFSKKNAEQE